MKGYFYMQDGRKKFKQSDNHFFDGENIQPLKIANFKRPNKQLIKIHKERNI